MENIANKHWPLFSAAILVLGGLWIGLTAAFGGTTTGGEIRAAQSGFSAPGFQLRSANEETLTLSDFRGQPVLINLWASWCGPCRAEMPAMQRVYEAYKDQGFVVLAVNATNQDSAAAALNFAEQFGLSFPILFDEDGRVSREYNLRALPSSYFVDADGVIQEVIIGGPMAEALLRVRVESLLEGDN